MRLEVLRHCRIFLHLFCQLSSAGHNAYMPMQVELQNCGIGAAGVRSIAEAAESNNGSSSKRASAMSLPELAANGVLPESSQETASSSRLHILRLDGNAAGLGAGKALQPLLGHVRELYVSSMGLGDEGLLPKPTVPTHVETCNI